MDRLKAMQVFVQVVDTGGFTRAADVLHLPKATVTTLVQSLEAHLGVKLLHRTTRRVRLTAEGAAYYERCIPLLADLEEAESAVSIGRASPRGRLRVDVGSSFGRELLVPALPEFFELFPHLRLDLGCSDRAVDLIEEGVDCVVRGGHQPDSALVAKRLGTVHFVICAAPAYLAGKPPAEHPQDLRKHDCVNYFSARTGRTLEWAFARDGERVVLVPEAKVAVNDGDAYCAAGLAGLGIIKAPEHLVRRSLAEGSLVQVLHTWRVDPVPLYVMYARDRHLSAKVRVFVEWVGEVFARSYPPAADPALARAKPAAVAA